ncbi:MAG: spirocyclase AveC family protein [Solirubrobacteraceae bacterium]
MTTTAPEGRLAVDPSALAVPRPARRPVLWWATFGAVCLAVTIYVFGSWILAGPHRIQPPGGAAVPTYMKVFVLGQEVAGFILFPLFIWWQLVRPWRRAGQITTTGLLCMALFLSTWQDPGLNFFNPVFVYNSYFFSLSSWASHIPFWYSPNSQHLAEPVLWNFFGYVYIWMGAALLGAVAMRRARARWPQISDLRLVSCTLLAFLTFDFLIELGWQLTGTDSYPGANSSLVLFPSHYYRVPIIEIVLAAPWWTALTCLLYFRDDRGWSLVERGTERVRAGSKARLFLRFLALVGAVNAIWFAYNVPATVVQGLYASAWPKDVTTRPYYVNGVCGHGTRYRCPWLLRP